MTEKKLTAKEQQKQAAEADNSRAEILKQNGIFTEGVDDPSWDPDRNESKKGKGPRGKQETVRQEDLEAAPPPLTARGSKDANPIADVQTSRSQVAPAPKSVSDNEKQTKDAKKR